MWRWSEQRLVEESTVYVIACARERYHSVVKAVVLSHQVAQAEETLR